MWLSPLSRCSNLLFHFTILALSIFNFYLFIYYAARISLVTGLIEIRGNTAIACHRYRYVPVPLACLAKCPLARLHSTVTVFSRCRTRRAHGDKEFYALLFPYFKSIPLLTLAVYYLNFPSLSTRVIFRLFSRNIHFYLSPSASIHMSSNEASVSTVARLPIFGAVSFSSYNFLFHLALKVFSQFRYNYHFTGLFLYLLSLLNIKLVSYVG